MAVAKNEISSEAQARRELARLRSAQAALEEARLEAGIPALEQKIEQLRGRITDWLVAHDQEQLQGLG
jgi:hypothetical protein